MTDTEVRRKGSDSFKPLVEFHAPKIQESVKFTGVWSIDDKRSITNQY